MSLRGGGDSSGRKEKKSKSGAGFKPTGRGGSSSGAGPSFTPPSRPPSGGATYTPGSSGGAGGSQPSGEGGGGGFKLPGLGGGGGGGGGGLNTIWGGEPTQPGITSTWSDGTKIGVAVVAGLLILGAVVALVIGLASGKKSGNTTQPASGGATTPFNPPTQAGATETDLPIVFTDGTTADLLYDQSLNLAGLAGGVQLSDSGTLGSIARGADQFQIDHGGASFVANELPTSVVRNVPGPNNSPVPVLPATANNQGKNVNGNWMDFHFGDWRVGVWEGIDNEMMSPTDEANWAASMSGSVTPSGWLTLSESGNLTLTPYGQPNGPQIQFGNISPTGIILTPQTCTAPLGAGVQQNANGVPYRLTPLQGGYEEGFLCQSSVNMTFDIYGTSQFVTTAANSLSITNLKLAPARPNPSSSPSPSS